MIAVVGAGAIGGLLAAELVAAGQLVRLCARRPLDRLVIERDARLACDVAGRGRRGGLGVRGAEGARQRGRGAVARGRRGAGDGRRRGSERCRAPGEPALTGAAGRHGIDVPLNRAILALLQGLDEPH